MLEGLVLGDETAFSRALREARKASGLSYRKMADLVPFTHSHLVRMETGDRNPPDRDGVIKIARALGGDVDAMLLSAGYAPENLAAPARVPGDWAARIPKTKYPPTPDEIARANELGQWAPPNMDPRTDMGFWARDKAARTRLFRHWEAIRDEYMEGEEQGEQG